MTCYLLVLGDIYMECNKYFMKDVSNYMLIWKSGTKIIIILNSMESSGIVVTSTTKIEKYKIEYWKIIISGTFDAS